MRSVRWEGSETHETLFRSLSPSPAEKLAAVRSAGRMYLFFRSSYHSLRLHDALSHCPHHSAGGRGLPKAGNDGLCSGRFGLRGFYHVCLRSVFPSKVPGNWHLSGPGCHPAPVENGTEQGIGPSLSGLLRRWCPVGCSAVLGHLANLPYHDCGYRGNGSAF